MNGMKALDGRKHGNGDGSEQVAEQMKAAEYVRLSEQVANR